MVKILKGPMQMATLTFTDNKGIKCEVPVIGVEMNTDMVDVTAVVTAVGASWRSTLPTKTEITITGIWNPPAGFNMFFEDPGEYWTDG